MNYFVLVIGGIIGFVLTMFGLGVQDVWFWILALALNFIQVFIFGDTIYQLQKDFYNYLKPKKQNKNEILKDWENLND